MVLTSRWPRMNWSYPTFLVERHFCPWHASLWLPVTCAQVNDEPIRWLQSLLQLERRHYNNKPVEMWFRSSKAIESCKELAEESYPEIAQTWMSDWSRGHSYRWGCNRQQDYTGRRSNYYDGGSRFDGRPSRRSTQPRRYLYETCSL